LITSLSSARRVCGETCPRTFLTSIIGGRIDRSDNGHRAIQQKLGLRLSGNTERSSQTLYSVACTTSISSQHDTSGSVLTRCTIMRAVKDRRVPSPHLSVTGRRKLEIVGISPFELRPPSLLVSPWAAPKTPDGIFAPLSTGSHLRGYRGRPQARRVEEAD
jgi:hypothetical protein